MSSIPIRLLAAEDLEAADELRRLAGWNQTLDDWRRLLALAPGGCFAVGRHGRVIATVTAVAYGVSLGWIGMMLVHPEHRGRGLARALMGEALGHLRAAGVGCIKLDATPAGRPVYEKLGFHSEASLTRWRRGPGAVGSQPPVVRAEVRSLTAADWPTIDALDAESAQADRAPWLRSLADGARCVRVCSRDGAVAGFGMLRPGDEADYLGPVVSRDEEGARALAGELLRSAADRAVVWDCFDDEAGAASWVRAWGFSPVRPFVRMRWGDSSRADPRDLPRRAAAIMDPSLG